MHQRQQELVRERIRGGQLISAVARTFAVHPATIDRVIQG
jgi:transposase-like protein